MATDIARHRAMVNVLMWSGVPGSQMSLEHMVAFPWDQAEVHL